jgi:phospholipid/cholesterol/gamma-HCH transport system ATP-binding protein
MIEFIDVHKAFGDLRVLRGINLTFEQGLTTVVLGRSGTGKSVTLKCIVGLLEPDSGLVLAEGAEIATMPSNTLEQWRSRCGFLFQGGAMYDSMTIGDNLVFPLRNEKTVPANDKLALAHEKLRWVGLEGTIDKFPADLSGGMRKRAALARTLMTDPEVILYDEPTTGLDPVTSNEISQLIARLKEEQGVTSIAVTHDMPAARLVADRIAFLHKGKVLATGTWEEIQQNDDPLVQFFLATEFTRDPIELDDEADDDDIELEEPTNIASEEESVGE